MMIFVYIIIGLSTFFFMEFMAWFTHKFVMHGLGWYFHEDHHQPTKGFFEKNDFYFLIFAIPSFLAIMLGVLNQNYISASIGFGIMAYGTCYFLVHDVLIHQRFKWFKNVHNPYFTALRKAHKIHHKRQGKEEGECFGMLIVPAKYFREAKRVYKLKHAK